MKLFAIGIFWFLLLNNTQATGIIIPNYLQLVKAVEHADDVKAIIHFEKCDLVDPANRSLFTRSLEEATTRFNFTQYLHYRERINNQFRDTVTTSISKYVEQTTGEPWLLLARLSVYDDETAILHVAYFDPIHFKRQLNIDWICTISNGRDDNGLVLYNFP